MGFWTVVGLIGWIILLWLWVQPHHLERTVKSRKWNYNMHKTNDYQNKIFWNIIKFCKNLKTQIVTDAMIIFLIFTKIMISSWFLNYVTHPICCIVSRLYYYLMKIWISSPPAIPHYHISTVQFSSPSSPPPDHPPVSTVVQYRATLVTSV